MRLKSLGLLVASVLCSALVQSSSIFTSFIVPLAANEIICLDSAYALTLGANIGQGGF